MTTFLFEFKDQMLRLKSEPRPRLKLDTKPRPRIGPLYGACGGCVFLHPQWCSTDEIRRESGPDCIKDKLVFVAADKATEEKLTILKIAERLKK